MLLTTTIFAPFTEITPAEYKRATEVTYLGFVYGTMAALKSMLPHDRGTIVQVGWTAIYSSCFKRLTVERKHAIAGFTDTLRTELLHQRQQSSSHDGADASA